MNTFDLVRSEDSIAYMVKSLDDLGRPGERLLAAALDKAIKEIKNPTHRVLVDVATRALAKELRECALMAKPAKTRFGRWLRIIGSWL